MKGGAYFRLMRFHKPVGILLLWLPTAWALWIANDGPPPPAVFGYFLLGTVFMRAAGCIVNDMADRHIDLHVERTKSRPLTTGEVPLPKAFLLLFFLLLAALFVVMQLPLVCFYYALAALSITILYPFCKRFFDVPQMILGLAFSMGIPMAYASAGRGISIDLLLLFLLNFAWIVAYDTMYAMVDREDDLRIGVKSSAILFGSYDRLVILLLQIITQVGWICLAMPLHYPAIFYFGLSVASCVFIYQQYLLLKQQRGAYLQAFSSNAIYGLVMWGTLILC